MSPYISLAILVVIIIWQGFELMKYESKFEKIQKSIKKTIENEDSKPKEEVLLVFLEDVCNAMHN